jgi:hypothetical protein
MVAGIRQAHFTCASQSQVSGGYLIAARDHRRRLRAQRLCVHCGLFLVLEYSPTGLLHFRIPGPESPTAEAIKVCILTCFERLLYIAINYKAATTLCCQ